MSINELGPGLDRNDTAHKLHLLGYFYGDDSKDVELIEKIHRVIADDAKTAIWFLEEVTLSRLRAKGKAEREGRPVPYDANKVENALLEIFPAQPSLTAFPARLEKKPRWWDWYSESFRKVLSQYYEFPEQAGAPDPDTTAEE